MPAGSTVALEGQVHMSGAHKDKWAVVEATSVSSLPGGLLVASSLCTLPVKRPRSMSILLRNETQHDITIPPRTVLAEIHAVQQVMGKEPSADSTTPEVKRMEFNFGKWFSVLDLKSGYYQVEMEEADKEKTVFVCPLGFWEFNRKLTCISIQKSPLGRGGLQNVRERSKRSLISSPQHLSLDRTSFILTQARQGLVQRCIKNKADR